MASGSYAPQKMGFTSNYEAPAVRPSTSPKGNSARRGSNSKSAILDKTKEIVELLDEYLEEKAVSKSTYKALRALVESVGSLA
jgi:hypothetical protein